MEEYLQEIKILPDNYLLKNNTNNFKNLLKLSPEEKNKLLKGLNQILCLIKKESDISRLKIVGENVFNFLKENYIYFYYERELGSSKSRQQAGDIYIKVMEIIQNSCLRSELKLLEDKATTELTKYKAKKRKNIRDLILLFFTCLILGGIGFIGLGGGTLAVGIVVGIAGVVMSGGVVNYFRKSSLYKISYNENLKKMFSVKSEPESTYIQPVVLKEEEKSEPEPEPEPESEPEPKPEPKPKDSVKIDTSILQTEPKTLNEYLCYCAVAKKVCEEEKNENHANVNPNILVPMTTLWPGPKEYIPLLLSSPQICEILGKERIKRLMDHVAFQTSFVANQNALFCPLVQEALAEKRIWDLNLLKNKKNDSYIQKFFENKELNEEAIKIYAEIADTHKENNQLVGLINAECLYQSALQTPNAAKLVLSSSLYNKFQKKQIIEIYQKYKQVLQSEQSLHPVVQKFFHIYHLTTRPESSGDYWRYWIIAKNVCKEEKESKNINPDYLVSSTFFWECPHTYIPLLLNSPQICEIVGKKRIKNLMNHPSFITSFVTNEQNTTFCPLVQQALAEKRIWALDLLKNKKNDSYIQKFFEKKELNEEAIKIYAEIAHTHKENEKLVALINAEFLYQSAQKTQEAATWILNSDSLCRKLSEAQIKTLYTKYPSIPLQEYAALVYVYQRENLDSDKCFLRTDPTDPNDYIRYYELAKKYSTTTTKNYISPEYLLRCAINDFKIGAELLASDHLCAILGENKIKKLISRVGFYDFLVKQGALLDNFCLMAKRMWVVYFLKNPLPKVEWNIDELKDPNNKAQIKKFLAQKNLNTEEVKIYAEIANRYIKDGGLFDLIEPEPLYESGMQTLEATELIINNSRLYLVFFIKNEILKLMKILSDYSPDKDTIYLNMSNTFKSWKSQNAAVKEKSEEEKKSGKQDPPSFIQLLSQIEGYKIENLFQHLQINEKNNPIEALKKVHENQAYESEKKMLQETLINFGKILKNEILLANSKSYRDLSPTEIKEIDEKADSEAANKLRQILQMLLYYDTEYEEHLKRMSIFYDALNTLINEHKITDAFSYLKINEFLDLPKILETCKGEEEQELKSAKSESDPIKIKKEEGAQEIVSAETKKEEKPEHAQTETKEEKIKEKFKLIREILTNYRSEYIKHIAQMRQKKEKKLADALNAAKMTPLQAYQKIIQPLMEEKATAAITTTTFFKPEENKSQATLVPHPHKDPNYLNLQGVLFHALIYPEIRDDFLQKVAKERSLPTISLTPPIIPFTHPPRN